jgi:hypothetical protein
MQESPKRQLLEHTYVGGNLSEDIASMLAEGKSWRTIAALVSTRSRCTVSHESLRKWFGPAKAGAA